MSTGFYGIQRVEEMKSIFSTPQFFQRDSKGSNGTQRDWTGWINKNDFLYEIGLGFDFYLAYFKFSPEIKANFGLTNLIVDDGSIYSKSIKEMKTRGFTISITFE